MTNFEKWHKEIGELKDNLAVVDGKPCNCGSTSCHDCEFSKNFHCVFAKWCWLWEECDYCSECGQAINWSEVDDD